MGYIYPKMLEDHKKYQKKNNVKSIRKFGKNINDLLATEEKTEQEIADEEIATHQSVHIILERALKNLKKILKKLD